MPGKSEGKLSRRERQILDALFEFGEASVQEVLDSIEDPPSYSAVRATLRIMEEKGHVRHRQDGPRYLYGPAQSKVRARKSALARVVDTFFAGSSEDAFAALLDLRGGKLDKDELKRLEERVRRARKEGR